MASFIASLSLFVLILSNGCFTLPIVDEQLWTSTFLPLNHDLTTDSVFNLRFVPENETNVLPDLEIKRSSDEHMGFEASTSLPGLWEANVVRASRTFDELSTSQPWTFTNERSRTDVHQDLLFPTVEPTTQVDNFERRSLNSEFENGTETGNDKQQMQVELTTNVMPSFVSTSSVVVPQVYVLKSSTSTSTEKYTGLLKDENEHVQEEEQVQPKKFIKTVRKPASTPAPEEELEQSTKPMKTLRKPVTTPAPEDEHEHVHEEEPEQSTKPMKTLRKPVPKPEVKPSRKITTQSEVESDEDSKESGARTAVFDQEALNKVSNVPNDFMVLDENNDFSVTVQSVDKISTSTMKNIKEKKPLNQGEESSHSEEKESDH